MPDAAAASADHISDGGGGAGGGLGGTSSRRVPGYARPNLSSRLPGALGCEHEAIKAAFAPGSYTSISDLGRPLMDGQDAWGRGGGGGGGGASDLPMSAGAMDASLAASQLPPSGGFKVPAKKGCFAEFEYSPNPYDLEGEVRARERKAHHERMQEIAAGQPFVAPGSTEKEKYETCFPYEADPFDTVKDAVLRGKWLEERKVLAGAFLPPGKDKALSKPSRALLTDMMAQLYKTLYEDWEELMPTVFNTAEDLVVVYFDTSSVKPQHKHGILAYMNILAKRGPVILRHDLRRVNEGWNVSTEGNHTMYAFRPPWVREKKFTAFDNAVRNTG